MYACMHVYVYVYVYVCMYMYTYACMHVCMYACMLSVPVVVEMIHLHERVSDQAFKIFRPSFQDFPTKFSDQALHFVQTALTKLLRSSDQAFKISRPSFNDFPTK